jgi:glycerophosphoryl diester phosphodiesterase
MPMKIFSHRGLIEKKTDKENKVESFQNAYKKGLRAIECDIWFLKSQLVLKHNRPSNLQNLDSLENLLVSFKNNVEYWLDFKNLNSKNCDKAVKSIKEIIHKNKIKLENLNFAPFITDLKKAKIIYQSINKNFGNKVKIIAVIEKLPEKNYQNFYSDLKSLETDGIKIYGLSIQWKNLNFQFKTIFKDIKIFAWTVNDKKTANFLEKIGIENIASDKLF